MLTPNQEASEVRTLTDNSYQVARSKASKEYVNLSEKDLRKFRAGKQSLLVVFFIFGAIERTTTLCSQQFANVGRGILGRLLVGVAIDILP